MMPSRSLATIASAAAGQNRARYRLVRENVMVVGHLALHRSQRSVDRSAAPSVASPVETADRCSVNAVLAPDPWQQRGYGGGHQSKRGCYRRHFDHGDRRTIREKPVHLGKSRAQEIL